MSSTNKIHTIETDHGAFKNPRAPRAGAVGGENRFGITVIADNPLSSCNYSLSRLENDKTTIAIERQRLTEHAQKVGYSGIAQIADYDTGECVTFRL